MNKEQWGNSVVWYTCIHVDFICFFKCGHCWSVSTLAPNRSLSTSWRILIMKILWVSEHNTLPVNMPKLINKLYPALLMSRCQIWLFGYLFVAKWVISSFKYSLYSTCRSMDSAITILIQFLLYVICRKLLGLDGVPCPLYTAWWDLARTPWPTFTWLSALWGSPGVDCSTTET